MYFPPFITARMGQKIGRRPQTQLCGAALIAVTQFPDLPFSLLPIRPYTLICSEALYQSALGPPAYGYVEVLGDPAAVSYQTDLALSRISTGLAFSNFRLQRQSWRQQLLLQLILALVLGLSRLMLVSLLRYGLETAQAQRKAQTRSLLWRLGAGRMNPRSRRLAGRCGHRPLRGGIINPRWESEAVHRGLCMLRCLPAGYGTRKEPFAPCTHSPLLCPRQLQRGLSNSLPALRLRSAGLLLQGE